MDEGGGGGSDVIKASDSAGWLPARWAEMTSAKLARKRVAVPLVSIQVEYIHWRVSNPELGCICVVGCVRNVWVGPPSFV